MDWVRDVDPKKPGLDFTRELDVLSGWFGDGKTGPALSNFDGMMFGADVPDDLPPPALNLPNGRWMDEAFPLDLLATLGGTITAPKLTLTKASAPKKNGLKGLEAEYVYADDNPSCATLTYTAKTGLFKGTFKLYYDGFTDKGVLQHKTVSVSYTGVMVPHDGGLLGLGTGAATINKQKVGMPVFLWKE